MFNRGNAGEKVFKGKRDKEKFLEYLGKCAEKFSVVIHTYCIMSNHYHFLIETQDANLSASIQWLNISYAMFYNKRDEIQMAYLPNRHGMRTCLHPFIIYKYRNISVYSYLFVSIRELFIFMLFTHLLVSIRG